MAYQKQPSSGFTREKLLWKYAASLQENFHVEVRFQ